MSRTRPWAAGRVPVPTRLALELARLVGRTHAELAIEYGTNVRAVASWYAWLDEHPGQELVASAYVPDAREIVDEAKRLLHRGLELLTVEIEHSTGKERIAIVRAALDVVVAIGGSTTEPAEAQPPADLERELADFLRITESPLDLDALRN